MTSGENGNLSENFDDFFEHSLSGHLILDVRGMIVRANDRFAAWIGRTVQELEGQRFTSLLSIGSRMFYETHLAPLLRMQGFYDEVAVELIGQDKTRIRVLINAYERRDENDAPLFIRVTAYRATERLIYEQNLRDSKDAVERDLLEERGLAVLREQFIAVLGHDLRNPLSAIITGASLIEDQSLDKNSALMLNIIRESGDRMAELIENVMDFARARMGTGLFLTRRSVPLTPVLTNVIEELRTIHPDAVIESELVLPDPVDCDPARVSQILSNLLANALTHGSREHPILVKAETRDTAFELSVTNHGRPIPPEIVPTLFQPFTREKVSASQHGLGLGLYIAAEIAKAHEGTLSVESSDERTCFTFRMPMDAAG